MTWQIRLMWKLCLSIYILYHRADWLVLKKEYMDLQRAQWRALKDAIAKGEEPIKKNTSRTLDCMIC
jgi:hypothetical protein